MQADGSGPFRWHTGHVDVVGIRHKAGDRAPTKKDYAAAKQLNAFIHSAVR